jgi:hypothetical protein
MYEEACVFLLRRKPSSRERQCGELKGAPPEGAEVRGLLAIRGHLAAQGFPLTDRDHWALGTGSSLPLPEGWRLRTRGRSQRIREGAQFPPDQQGGGAPTSNGLSGRLRRLGLEGLGGSAPARCGCLGKETPEEPGGLRGPEGDPVQDALGLGGCPDHLADKREGAAWRLEEEA